MRKIAIGFAAGTGVLLAAAPAGAADLPPLGDATSEGVNGVVLGAKKHFHELDMGVREPVQNTAGGLGG